ncbi:MAG: type IV pilin protein [Pseudomonadota bacterium]|nr:type IV pilin protein [Pseudomonadota bacterium]
MSSQRGFTLIEMMIAVIVIGILAAIALPAYQDYVREARRADALDSLMYIQNLQEKWRANNPAYGSLANIGFTGTTSVDGYYSLAVSGASATGFVVTATGLGPQASDTGCTSITLTVSAANPRGVKAPASCWNN